MAESNKALYASCVAGLGFVCLVLGATAVGLPMWGYFDTPTGGPGAEKGYFGPWKTCKLLLYSRERCGPHDARFKTSVVVWLAGLASTFSAVALAIFCVLSVLQIAMINSKEKVVLNYSVAVMSKLALSLLATLLSVSAAILFALQTDDKENNGFEITRGEAFYIQIVCIALDLFLFILAVYDVIFTRRSNGDPTKGPDETPQDAVTYGNPGYRERSGGTNGTGVSVTDASGKPYVGVTTAAANGSMASMNTTVTSASNGSTIGSVGSVTRSPLRSSLKKPKPKEGLGIQNPGFSGTSPTLSRNGSTKKVRIQTHSTEV